MPRGEKTISIIENLQGFEKVLIPYRKNFSYCSVQEQETLDFELIDQSFRFVRYYNGKNNGKYIRPPANIYSGRFFEEVAVSLFGGKINDHLHYIGQEYALKPDINYSQSHWGEVKSCVVSSPQKFERLQISKFACMLLENSLPKIDFFLFQHNTPKIIANYKNQIDLAQNLKENIIFCLIVPLQIPMQFFLNSDINFKGREYNYNCYGLGGYQDRSVMSISSTFLREMFASPKDTLEKIFLDASDFQIDRYSVKGLKVNNRKINDFKLMKIDSINGSYLRYIDKNIDLIQDLALFSFDYSVNLRKKRQLKHEDYPENSDFMF